ncbi:hypothetical protein DL96DRAFT_1712383 [Flagelloscypha sp. PMI_526]|nr:hypothetical protein DL96DRAFT_1712383 [Flagelloscypha sp. PMI_526]
MFYALGRPKVVTERVLEILLSSGARFSRYLCQLAIHCKFHTAGASHPFLKYPWARALPFDKFMALAAARFGDIPTEKGADDGSIFNIFIKEARIEPENKTVKWEEIRDLFAKYQYRDFVFRKLFEKPVTPSDDHARDIVRNVRELCRLDSCLFVSRTVASEICMEALANEPAYRALKQLDKSQNLPFELPSVVADLLKMFHRSRGISSESLAATARRLFKDFPAQDLQIRHTMLLTACFTRQGNHETSPIVLRGFIDDMGLSPVSFEDLKYLLLSPFIERPNGILNYARHHCKLSRAKQKELLTAVAKRCLTIPCKGKFLQRLCEAHEYLYEVISKEIIENWGKRLELENVTEGMNRSTLALCRCHIGDQGNLFVDDTVAPQENGENRMEVDSSLDEDSDSEEDLSCDDEALFRRVPSSYSLETLSAMIAHEEALPTRTRRRWYFPSTPNQNSSSRLPYPLDPIPISKFIYNHYGASEDNQLDLLNHTHAITGSPVTAVMLKYAIVQGTYNALNTYLPGSSCDLHHGTRKSVPITLEHFQIMARVGSAPPHQVWTELTNGAHFYETSKDYLPSTSLVKTELVKEERAFSASLPPSPSRLGKRPRRSAASASVSYIEPHSDDEDIVPDEDLMFMEPKMTEVKVKVSQSTTPRQLWIQNLEVLEMEEKAKHRELKKLKLREAVPGTKVIVYRTEFFKSLAQHLCELKRIEWNRRVTLNLQNDQMPSADDSDDDDPEYTPNKRRKV